MKEVTKLELQQQISEYQQAIKEESKPKGLALGMFPINYLLYYFIPLLIFAPLFSYYTAVTNNQAKPFPHTTVTNMSRFYPQDVVFRFLMLPAGGFINLIYFVIFGWIKKVKKETGYPGSTEEWMFRLGQLSVIGYYMAVATIDGGNLPNLHIFGAIFFFLMLFMISTVLSFVLKDMHEWNTSIMSSQSLLVKMLIAIYLIAVAVYSIAGGLFELSPANEDDKYVVIYEWNLVLGGLLWLATFRSEWGNVFIVLRVDAKIEES